jgi:hypothetical protein
MVNICFYGVQAVATIDNDFVQLSFQNPFPLSWYQKSIDSSRRLWGDMQFLLKTRDHINSEESLLLIHSALGQLLYVHHCVQQLHQDRHTPLYEDDGAYLGALLHKISGITYQLSEKFSHECLNCFAPLFDKINATLNQIPQE